MKLLTDDEMLEMGHDYMEETFTGKSQKAYNVQMDAFMAGATLIHDLIVQSLAEDMSKRHLKQVEKLLMKHVNSTKVVK